MRRYAWNILIALDQFVNVMFFMGDPDETISSHAGKAARKGKRWACVLCKILDRIDMRHCEKNIEADEGDPA